MLLSIIGEQIEAPIACRLHAVNCSFPMLTSRQLALRMSVSSAPMAPLQYCSCTLWRCRNAGSAMAYSSANMPLHFSAVGICSACLEMSPVALRSAGFAAA